jgi:uncharacterized paraquat-inducible protein A
MMIIPALNTFLLFIVMGLMLWRSRMVDLTRVWDEIEALKLRLSVQEKVSPCEHCRKSHSHISPPDAPCDC